MPFRKLKPTSPGTRFRRCRSSTRSRRKQPYKPLVEPLHSNRRPQQPGTPDVLVARRRPQADVPHHRLQAEQVRHSGEGDDDRCTTRIARRASRLLTYADGEKRYILQPAGLKVGDSIVSGQNVDILTGNALPLKNIPLGTLLHNVELKPGKGGQIARSAGSSVQLVAKEGDYASVKMPSERDSQDQRGVLRDDRHGRQHRSRERLDRQGRAQPLEGDPSPRARRRDEPGRPSAGRRRRQDSGGRHPVTPWGMPTKGYKTRNSKTTDRYIVQRRQK